ncbi:MAG TPA: hypothetical protein VMW48_19250, partial [Vicinamibacterales bacterium]|nr:hypothetical protein [Vicinamibacterales bacterium]
DLEGGDARLVVQTPRGEYGPVRLGLRGAHQAGNALVAIRLLEAMSTETGTPVGRAAIEAALAEVRWPARLEWLRHSGTGARVLIDAAHNPASARALGDYLARTGARDFTLVTSVMTDKNVAGVLGPLMPYVRRVVVTSAHLPRATEPAVLAAQVAAFGPPGLVVEIDADPGHAVARGLALAAPVLLTGSIYLVGPLRAALVAEGFQSA